MDGSYWLDRIGWIVWIVSAESYWLDCIGLIILARLYWLDYISVDLEFSMRNWILCAGWFAIGWMGWLDRMGRWCDVGGMEGSTLAGARTGAPPLSLEGRKTVGSCDWYQLSHCCKGAKYFCWSTKIIQIDLTKIRTNT